MFLIKKFIYLIVFTIFIQGAAVAAGGEEAYQRGRDIRLQGGDPEENNKRAAGAFREAVAAGHLRAHAELGMMYLKGDGVSHDPAKARELFKTASEKGLVLAQYQLAELMRKGLGGEQNMQAAIKWYEQAGKQGHVAAMSKLGQLYSGEEEGIEADYPRAYAWYILAKQNGGFVSNGKLEIIERSMGPKGMDKVKKLVRELNSSENQG